jgi:hypothetical protein
MVYEINRRFYILVMSENGSKSFIACAYVYFYLIILFGSHFNNLLRALKLKLCFCAKVVYYASKH